ncbi:MAG TPA: hypothetical protein VJN21_02830 [Candidatus Acidoferrales bacterium]|nr:hypothetical protein [Candidatus Acidoferrales bacterium]
MPAEKSPSNPASGPEHRRSSRFPVVVPLEVSWREANGAQFKESAKATEVNAHGALLHMKTYPTSGVEAQLANLMNDQTASARIGAIRRSRNGEVQGIAIELAAPNEVFWGLNFQLRKASAELLSLEQRIKTKEIDPFILREFRDAVDYVRKTAWAVQEWRERQITHRDPQTVLSLLSLERIRRATTMSNDLLSDLKTQNVTQETEGIAELLRATDGLHRRLTEYFKGNAND